jgi:L-2-hydroxycarboxylate dehydrogenase (NAD+)
MSISNPEDSGTAHLIVPAELEALLARLFTAAGLDDHDAKEAAHILVEADLRGVWSHGVARVAMYLERMRKGVMNAKPNIRVEQVMPAAVLVDGDHGFGLIVAPRAMAEAVRMAKVQGIGLAGVLRSNHFATNAYYVERAAEAGCIGMVFTNASPALAPWGASKAFLGASPFGFAAPTPEGKTFVIDMAMSRVARGKLKFAAARGEAIPEGYALDKDGKPTTDGKAAFEGTMLPFGEYKGAALSWMMDVLGGAFTGAAFGGDVGNPFSNMERPADVGHVFVAIRADLFMPIDAFTERMGELDKRIKALPKAVGFDEILSPGEPEARRKSKYSSGGIPVPINVLEDLRREAERAHIAWPFSRTTGGAASGAD